MVGKYFKLKNKFGLTIVELMVVIGIFAVISGIILFNYRSFQSNATVNVVAQEIALTMGKARSYALGLQAPGAMAILPIKGYGVRFDSAINDQITFFVELATVDNQFTTSSATCGNPVAGSECVEYYKIGTGDKIKSIIVDTEEINLTDQNSSIDIIFKKPSGDMVFCVHKFSSTCSSSASSSVGFVDIVLESKNGINKTVHIYGNGQISVE